MILCSNYAVEVIPAALFAAPVAPSATSVDATWNASADHGRVVGTGMKDAVKRQARPPRGIPL